MSESASLTSGVSGRYATAIFDLAKEAGQIDAVGSDMAALEAALGASDDLRALITSPVYSRDEQGQAMAAVAAKMGLSGLVTNLIGLMAANRRLFALPGTVQSVLGLIADHRGVVTAEVTAARPLSSAQSAALSKVLAEAADGKTINVKTTVDESLIGGLVVKLGSRMVDTSIRSKLDALKNTMKEVG